MTRRKTPVQHIIGELCGEDFFGELYLRVDGLRVMGQHGLPDLFGRRVPVIRLERFFLQGLFRFFRVVNFIVLSSRIQTYLSAIQGPASDLRVMCGVSA